MTQFGYNSPQLPLPPQPRRSSTLMRVLIAMISVLLLANVGVGAWILFWKPDDSKQETYDAAETPGAAVEMLYQYFSDDDAEGARSVLCKKDLGDTKEGEDPWDEGVSAEATAKAQSKEKKKFKQSSGYTEGYLVTYTLNGSITKSGKTKKYDNEDNQMIVVKEDGAWKVCITAGLNLVKD